MKKILYIIIILLGAFLLSGCESQKEFTIDDLTITLPKEFEQKEMDGYLAYLESKEVGITFLEENFTDLETIGLNKDSTLEDYANAVKESNNANYEIKEGNNYLYFIYDNTVDETTYHYMSNVFKSDDEFYLITFFCFKEDTEKYESEFIKWADSIKLKK